MARRGCCRGQTCGPATGEGRVGEHAVGGDPVPGDEDPGRVGHEVARPVGRGDPGLRAIVCDHESTPEPGVHQVLAPCRMHGVDQVLERGVVIRVRLAVDRYEPARDADVLVVLTEWGDYRELDPDKVAELMSQPAIVDSRNLLDRAAFQRRGFRFLGTGR